MEQLLDTIKFTEDYVVSSGKFLHLKYGCNTGSIELGLGNKTQKG